MSEYKNLVLDKKRTLGELVNDSFVFLGLHIKALIVPYLLVTLPLALLSAFPLYSYSNGIYGGGRSIFRPASALPFHFSMQIVGGFALTMLLYSIAFVSGMAMVLAYVQEIELNKTERPSFATVMGAFGRVFPKVIVSSIPVLLLTVLAYVLLVIPGIWFSLVACIFYPVLVVEKLSFRTALKRALFLVKGAWWQTFLILLISSFVVGAITGVVSMAMSVFIIVKNLHSLDNSAVIGGSMFYATFIPSLLRIVLQVFPLITLTLQYYNLREEKEGVSLTDRIAGLGMPAEPIVSTRKEEF